MKRKKPRNILLKMVLFIFILLINIDNISAEKQYKEIKNGKLPDCEFDQGCMILCSYSNYGRLDTATGSYEVAEFIGYNYKYNMNQETSWKWKIDAWGGDRVYNFQNLYIPSEGIVFNESKKDWDSSDEYRLLEEQFKCPKFATREDDIIMADQVELCFANDGKSCGKNKAADFDLSPDHLVYDFVEDEFKKVIDNTLDDNMWISPELANITNAEKALNFLKDIEFISQADLALSQDEQLDKVCKLLEEKQDTGSLEQTLINEKYDKNYIEKILNPKLNKSASNNNAKYPSIFTYDGILEFLVLEYKDSQPVIATGIKDSKGISYYDKVIDSYSKELGKNLEYLADGCNNRGYDIEISTEKLIELQKINAKNDLEGKINFDEKLDCETLFSGEIAEIIKTAYFLIELVAIIILIVFTALDYAKAILSGEQDEMKKNNQKLIKRIIIVVVILLLPALINLVLGLFNIEGFNSENPLCIKINDK